ncbi:hypothetical protein HK097_002804 [Rhizophlyctis rosea]|uniref:Uncharacterized protein n=1 Tax=Rhizophlyctis rosea TaxID=64517 RepID=A0AAD5S326_9FUNG|nr:hypothetical protein HK097_002804 [Rhizophlyctis rosea]
MARPMNVYPHIKPSLHARPCIPSPSRHVQPFLTVTSARVSSPIPLTPTRTTSTSTPTPPTHQRAIRRIDTKKPGSKEKLESPFSPTPETAPDGSQLIYEGPLNSFLDKMRWANRLFYCAPLLQLYISPTIWEIATIAGISLLPALATQLISTLHITTIHRLPSTYSTTSTTKKNPDTLLISKQVLWPRLSRNPQTIRVQVPDLIYAPIFFRTWTTKLKDGKTPSMYINDKELKRTTYGTWLWDTVRNRELKYGMKVGEGQA